MPDARATAPQDTARSTQTAVAVLVAALVVLAALAVGAATGVVPKSPTFAGQVPGLEYVSSQARGSAFSLP